MQDDPGILQYELLYCTKMSRKNNANSSPVANESTKDNRKRKHQVASSLLQEACVCCIVSSIKWNLREISIFNYRTARKVSKTWFFVEGRELNQSHRNTHHAIRMHNEFWRQAMVKRICIILVFYHFAQPLLTIFLFLYSCFVPSTSRYNGSWKEDNRTCIRPRRRHSSWRSRLQGSKRGTTRSFQPHSILLFQLPHREYAGNFKFVSTTSPPLTINLLASVCDDIAIWFATKRDLLEMRELQYI